jgi:hypothetical protein
MKKILAIIMLFPAVLLYGSSFTGKEKGTVYNSPNSIENVKTPNTSTDRFAYAELMYQKNYGKENIWVSGINVSLEIQKEVSTSKYRDEALDIMGKDGWELVSVFTRNFESGFEIFYYFKKRIN